MIGSELLFESLELSIVEVSLRGHYVVAHHVLAICTALSLLSLFLGEHLLVHLVLTLDVIQLNAIP
jgi:hypothetical protein